ncbi:putative histone-fold-containing protein [Lyophyllum shimeji]|uniref:DNA polymerase epsilon subunit D n=1 Tax=Lyophyllum shimeji TaxID=47721 RepID=A0A9P3URV7_LYOSH|nr:putative histone-fold-containing protein [Lyophyllum shimeji]
MPRKDAGGGPISAQAQQDLVSDGIENFELPKSLVTKIAKSAIPENSKLQKETVLSLVKGSTVFINYLAATAHDVAVSKQHKSISASDVLKALELIEFGDLVDKLQAELLIYRQHAKTDKTKKSVSVSVPPSKPKSAASGTVSAPAPATKLKGKEKAAPGQLPPPFTSTPLVHAHGAGESASTGAGATMDVDWEAELGEAADAADTDGDAERGGFDEDDLESDLEGAVDDAEEGVEDGDEDVHEGEAPEDPMEVEEELRRDTRGSEGMEDHPHSDGS